MNPKRFRRIPPYAPPPSFTFRKMLEAERDAIARGETEGLDPTKQYVAMRVGRDGHRPVWIVAESPADTSDIDGVVLFVSAVTLGTAIEMVKNGAELHG